MLTAFKQETTTTNTNTMAPVNKNIVFEIVDDIDEFLKSNEKSNEKSNKNNDTENTNIRQDYERHDALSDDDFEILDEILIRKKASALPSTIFRFKFTENFMEELSDFSKIHQYDHRKDFKEAWVKWTAENEDLVTKEVQRLVALGYPNEEDIVDDKMFKSARYYFRKKSSIKAEPKQRRQYIGVDHELLETMDRHIIANIHNDDYKPKSAFVMFCKENEDVLKHTIAKMETSDVKLIQDKIKKTYKNRYFMLTNK
jgi:hypothetical protein